MIDPSYAFPLNYKVNLITLNIEERKPIWEALSKLYIDSELQELDFLHIAIKITKSPYSLCEVKKINKYEVFPVLQKNQSNVAGEWKGFNEEWLVRSILNSLETKNVIKKIRIEGCFLIFKWMQKDYWGKLEQLYKALIIS